MEEQQRLESWKEISVYLKRSLRTCQRWEIELGLPVHRLDGTPKARVFAFPEELDKWMGKKLHLAQDLAEAKTRSKHRLVKNLFIFGGVCAVGLTFIIWYFFPFPIPVPFNNPYLAVLPFENAQADEGLESWRTAFPDLIITDLRQSRYVNVPGISDVDRGLIGLQLAAAKKFTPEDVDKAAKKLDSDFAATGTLTRNGKRIFITVSLHDIKSGKVIKSLRADVRKETGFFVAADTLSKKIKRALRLSHRQRARDIDKNVTKIATSSIQAFKLYGQGYRLSNQQKYREAIASFEKAIELDPSFGLAYKYLAMACRNTGRTEDLITYAKKAIELSERTPERERLLLEAEFYEFFQRDLAKALEANEALWALYPDFPEAPGGRLFLPNLYFQFEEYDKAIAVLEKLNPKYRRRANVMSILYQSYLAMGLFEKVDKALAEFQTVNPADARIMLASWRKKRALEERKFDEALAFAGESNLPRTNYAYYSGIGYIYWAQDDFANAEKQYRTALEQRRPADELQRLTDLAVLALSKGKIEEAVSLLKKTLEFAREAKSSGAETGTHFQLARLYRLSGRLADALEEAEAACRDYENRGYNALPSLHMRALISLDLGRSDEFEKQAEEIKKIIQRDPYPMLMRIYYHLLGCRELKKGNSDGAVGYFWRAVDSLPPVKVLTLESEIIPYFYSLAEAYLLRRNPSAAGEWFDKCVNMTGGRSWSGDIYARSYYRLAKIHEDFLKSGSTQKARDADKLKAIENYTKFLSLMAEADPVFSAEIEDARASLARLQAK
jgi:tetratricopeptide (TPR) repeat protein